MARMVKRLTGLEIDEVSLVNRPANQHGLVAIAKSQQEDSMSVYDAAGDEVFEEELEHGDRVYDETGAEFVFVEEEADEDEGEEDVEKASLIPRGPIRPGWMGAKDKASLIGQGAKAQGAKGADGAVDWAQKHKTPLIASAAGAGGLGAGYTGGRMHKSLGSQVLEDLSKALSDDDRDQVFAKAADRFDEIAQRNELLEQMVVGLYEDRDAEGYSQLAKSYELPVDPDEIGAIMVRASQSLSEADMGTLDRVVSSVGEISKAAFTEIGYGGNVESDALAQIFAVAGDAVSKSDNGMSHEQAVTALFSANPDAYDQYEAEARFN